MNPMQPSYDLLLRDGRLADGTPMDIGIRGGTIATVEARLEGGATQELPLEGRMILPAFVEAHTHLDKSLTYSQGLNQSGTLREAIARMHVIQSSDTVETIFQRALATARLFLAHGTTTIRTHVDVTQFSSLRGVEALLRLREELDGLIRIQLVALTHPILGEAGATNRELVEEALRLGVDLVGGAPALEENPQAAIDTVFALADRYDRDIDLHIDESDDPCDFCLPYLAKKTIAEGRQGRVVAGHCCSLTAVDNLEAERVIELVREAGIAVVTLPSANMYLQGRKDHGPIRRGVTRVRQLLEAGIPLACGSDNIRDPFNPFGRGDLLLVANLLAHAAHLGSPSEQATAIGTITAAAAHALGLSSYGIAPGAVADLVVLDTTDPAGALAAVPPRRYVIAGGRLAAETETIHRLQADASPPEN